MIEESSESYGIEEFEDQEEYFQFEDEFSDSEDEIEIIDDEPVIVDNYQSDFFIESGSGSDPLEFTVENGQNVQNEKILLSGTETTTESEELEKIYQELVTVNENLETLSSETKEIKEDFIVMSNNEITFWYFGIGIMASIFGGLVASSLLRGVQ